MRSILPIIALPLAISVPAFAEAQVVSVPQFRSIELHAGGDVHIVPGPVQRVTLVRGSTALTHFRVDNRGRLEITTDCRERDCPHEYNLQIRVESPQVPDVAVKAGGTIVADPGFAPQHQVSAAVFAGGTIDLRALGVDSVSAAVNAGGDIYVRPRATLAAAVNAGGDILYSGNPQVSMAVSNGGDVRKER